jgi:hypothetical protein
MTTNQTKTEAIANADAHTSNAGLPSYSHLLTLLVYLREQAKLGPLPKNNAAMLKAQEALEETGRSHW